MSVKQVFNTSAELDYPSVLPTLDLDFANSKTLDPRITFERASGGSYVGADGLIKYAGVNEARFDHDPETGESLGLLIEESRTNLLSWSEDISQTSYYSVSGESYTINTTETSSPDGKFTANKYLETSVSSSQAIIAFSNTTVAENATVVFSIFIKTIKDRNKIRLTIQNGTTGGSFVRVHINLETGIVENSDSFGDAILGPYGVLQKFPNGWYRVYICGSLGNTTTPIQVKCWTQAVAQFPTVSSGGARVGDPSTGVYVWGAQLEQGSFPTSYIPTSASTVTRQPDDASITGKNFSDFYNQDEGTVLVNLSKRVPIHTEYNNPRTGLVAIQKSGFRGIYIDYRKDDIRVDGSSRNSSISFFSGVVNESSETPDVLKSILSYSNFNSTFSFISNLSQIVNSGTLTPTEDVELIIGRFVVSGTNSGSQYTNGTISRLTYFPKRLPNEQLIALTQ